jgi:hypothetical protein
MVRIRHWSIRLSQAFVALGVAAALISCVGQSPLTPPESNGAQNSLIPKPQITATSCYEGDNGTPATVSATTTFYGWWDNSPPGGAIAHPVIHATAGGVGSFCDPTTFATEPTKAENKKIPYGTRIYIPFLEKYFIREDDCTNSGPASGSGSNGCSGLWFDNWIGGNAKTKKSALFACEDDVTPNGKVDVILHPNNAEPVDWLGPIYSNSTGCNNGPDAISSKLSPVWINPP